MLIINQNNISSQDIKNKVNTVNTVEQIIYIQTNHESKIDFSVFPNTRYYGSKKRILKWIYENLKDLEFKTVLDCFGGTASVSLLFQTMNKHVTFNDALKSNTIFANVLLRGGISNKQLFKYEQLFTQIMPVKNGFISSNFQNIFFLDRENEWLDGAINTINNLPNKIDKQVCLYVLCQACLMKRPFNIFHRANLYLRTADVKRKFGNLTTWNTPFIDITKRILYELHKLPVKKESNFKVLATKSAEEIKNKYDLVYIDPPYITDKINGDGYWKKYHFLEGLVNYEDWALNIDNTTKIKMLKSNDNIKKWESKNEFKQRLFDLIEYHKNSIVVLSYMTNAIPSINELEEFFKLHFKEITINIFPLSHALAKSKRTEILMIGVPYGNI